MPVCPACAQSNPARARFCMSCGSALPLEEPAPQVDRKTVTVLFCDVTDSTPLGERLDPESVREVMTRFFRDMREVLERHGGTVEKYIGDAVMAVFGVPLLHEDDALRAVEAARAMHIALDELNGDLEPRYGVVIRIRTGVNTGEVVVGDPASGEALVVGDAVNVAARLEQVAAPGEVLLGPTTHALVRQHVTAEPTGPLSLKGKREEIAAFRLLEVRPARDAIGERPDPPLVGRDEELALLSSAFERVTARSATALVTVVGSAGVGKSRLAREFVASLPAEVAVMQCRALPYGDGITFWPVTELVKQACGITDDESRTSARGKIDAFLIEADDADLLIERVAGVTGFGDESATLEETFWAIRRFLEWMGRARPLVLVLDDLHWAEETFLDLVEYLAGWMSAAGVLLLCLTRPDLMDHRPVWASGAPDATTLPLPPLGDEETKRFIAGALGSGLRGPLLSRIEEAAGGNPLFLEEMLRMLEDEGLLQRRDGRWVASGDLADVRLPDSIQALLGARLDRLSPEERAVIRCASVVGKVFWWGAVAELVDPQIRPHVGAHLQSLVRRDLIRPERSSLIGEDAFGFHHSLIQEAAYRGAPKDARADLHARFASWIEATAGDRLAEVEALIGYHLERAFRYRAELETVGDAERALAARAAGWLARAGSRAVERRDARTATDLLRRSADLFPADAPARGRVLLDLSDMLTEGGELIEAESALEEAHRIAGAAGDESLRASAAIMRLFLLESTDPKRLTVDAVGEAERLIATLERLGDDLGLARAWRLMGDLHWTRSRYAAADQALEHAIHHARRAGAHREEADALGRYAGSGVYGPAPVEEIERRCAELLERTSGGGYEAPALRALASVRAMQGRFDEARQLAARSRAILEDLGLRLRATWVSETTGTIEMLAGDFVAAERELRDGFDAAAEVGEQGFQATVAALLAHALLDQGRVEEADRLVSLTETTAADDDLASQVLWRGARARVLSRTGAGREAVETAEEGVALAEGSDDVNMQADALVDLGEVLLELGHRQDAVASFAEALKHYDAKGNRAAAERVRARGTLNPPRVGGGDVGRALR